MGNLHQYIWQSRTRGRAGSGDVLTGILAALTAQFKTDDWTAVLALGVYLHGTSRRVRYKKHRRVGPSCHGSCRRRALRASPASSGVAKRVSEEVITHSAEETNQWGREFAKTARGPCAGASDWRSWVRQDHAYKRHCRGARGRERRRRYQPHIYPGSCLRSARDGKVYHADLYRIESFHDFETLGLEDVFGKPAVVILEWSSASPCNPWPQFHVKLEHLGGNARRIQVT